MSKETLQILQESGEHLFHGTPDGTIQIMEPRQARHVPDLDKPDETIPDGDPAVCVTPHADLATFRAIVNRANVPFSHTSGFGITNGEKSFHVSSEEVLHHVKGKKGFVYVFDKDQFTPYDRNGIPRNDSMEWRSNVPVTPTQVIEVTDEDLPDRENIEIGKSE